MTFSEKIDKLLKDNNIKSLRKLSEEIQIPYTTLWDYYSNPIRLDKANLTYIKKIAKHLKCTVDYLAYDELETPQATLSETNTTIINHQTLEEFITENKNDIISQYKMLFNKDYALTDEQKNFIIDFIEDKHQKVDNNEKID